MMKGILSDCINPSIVEDYQYGSKYNHLNPASGSLLNTRRSIHDIADSMGLSSFGKIVFESKNILPNSKCVWVCTSIMGILYPPL